MGHLHKYFPWSLQNGIFLFALKLSNWYFQGMDFWKFGALRVTFQEIGFDFLIHLKHWEGECITAAAK